MTRSSLLLCHSWHVALLLALPIYGCASDGASITDTSEVDPLVLAENGLIAANGLSTYNGLNTFNGLNSNNGLNTYNGLSTYNGLNSNNGLMTYASGRTLVRYVVECALPPGRTLIKKDQNGVDYPFPGSIGLAPGWSDGTCDTACQEKVTACLMSLTNSVGRHVAVELVSAAAGLTAIGSNGDDVEYPNQEGAVFGNLFVSPPKMFTCTGTESPKAEQVKRYCIDGTPCDLFTKVGSCATACTTTCTVGPGGKQVCSAKSCKDPSGKIWANPITVFLHNKMEANNFDGQSGITTAGLSANGMITSVDNGDWVQMNDVQFGTVAGAVKSVLATLATPGGAPAGNNVVDVRVDSPGGKLLGSIPVRATPTGNTFVVQSAAINTDGLTGRRPVFFSFRGGSNMANISYFELK